MEEDTEEPEGKLVNMPDEKKQIEQKRQRILKAVSIHNGNNYKFLSKVS
jgi:hypothetical protein